MLKDSDILEAKGLIESCCANGGRAADQLNLAGLKLDKKRVFVRNDAIDNLVELGRFTPIIGKFLDDDLLLGFPLHKLERAGANRRPAELLLERVNPLVDGAL